MSDVRSAQELSPWLAPVSDGVIACKDSGLLACFEFEGIDTDGSSQAEIMQAAIILDRMTNTLRDMPVTIWWTVRRQRTWNYPEGRFENEHAQAVDEDNRKQFFGGANFVNRHFFSISLMPPTGTDKFFGRISSVIAAGGTPLQAITLAGKSLLSKNYSFAWKAEEISGVLAQYEGKLEQIESSLGFLNPKRLRGTKQLGFLWSTANPGLPMAEKSWDGESYLDSVVSERPITVGADTLQFGDSKDATHLSGISMKAWPDFTDFGGFTKLLSVGSEMTLSLMFRVASTADTEKEIQRTKRFNDLLKYPPKSWIMSMFRRGGEMNESNANPARARASAEAQQALGELTSGENFWGWTNLTMVIYDDDEQFVEDTTKDVLRFLHGTTYQGAIRESVHLLSAWSATQPGQWASCKRWGFFSAKNMVDAAPVVSVSAGHPINEHLSEQLGKGVMPALSVFPTDYRTPFYFNFHSGALGHTLIVGPSRAGKSVMLNFLISQWQKYPLARTMIFDKDNSCKIATVLQGGQHIDLRPDGEIRLNPMKMVVDRKHWGFLASWIEVLICSRGYQVTSGDAKQIMEAIEGIAVDMDEAHHRLLSVYTLLPPHLQEHLNQWVGDQPLARYFDNVEDSFDLGRFTCIEMNEVMRDPSVAQAFLDYAFYRLQRQLEEAFKEGADIDISPTLIYVEECWFLLQHEKFREKVKDWLKTFAKLNAILLLTTQSLEDIAETGGSIFAAMRDNIPTRIFLPNAKAVSSDDLRRLYTKEFELTDVQVARIASAVPREEYMVIQPGVARMIKCKFTKGQLARLRSDVAAQKCFQRHRLNNKASWKNDYVAEMTH